MKGTGVIMKNKSISLDQPLVQVDSEEAITKLVNMKYKKYLETEYWSLVRNTMHELIGYKCEICGAIEHIHIHHFNYGSIGKETFNDLACLCEECHLGIHGSESALFISQIFDRNEFIKRLQKAKKIKNKFTNKQFLKVLPLTQKSAWEIKQLQILFECSAEDIIRKYEAELKSGLVEKSLGSCGTENFEFYSLDKFIWYVLRLDFPKVDG